MFITVLFTGVNAGRSYLHTIYYCLTHFYQWWQQLLQYTVYYGLTLCTNCVSKPVNCYNDNYLLTVSCLMTPIEFKFTLIQCIIQCKIQCIIQCIIQYTQSILFRSSVDLMEIPPLSSSLGRGVSASLKCRPAFIVQHSTHHQCDQMARLFVQYLAIYSNEICPIATTIYQSGLNIFPNIKWTF